MAKISWPCSSCGAITLHHPGCHAAPDPRDAELERLRDDEAEEDDSAFERAENRVHEQLTKPSGTIDMVLFERTKAELRRLRGELSKATRENERLRGVIADIGRAVSGPNVAYSAMVTAVRAITEREAGE